MIPPPDAIQREGQGADVVFLHATGAGKSSWHDLIALLEGRIRATAYDRRGAASWAIADDEPPPRVQDHAADAADLIESFGTAPVHVCGMSFGAVVTLELLTRRPDLVRSAILFEPALPCGDHARSARRELTGAVAGLIRDGHPERAAEHFYRSTIGELPWTLLPEAVRRDMLRRGKQIWCDLCASTAYSADYEAFARLQVPVLLLQGGRSSGAFVPALMALRKALPQAKHAVLQTAAHVPQRDAWREFAAAAKTFLEV